MVPKINRLTKKKDFETVSLRGVSVKNAFLICKILRNNTPENRFGFVVSKKVSTKATIRNKVKRRLRSIIILEKERIEKSFDIIIITLPGIEKKEFIDLREMLIICFTVFAFYSKHTNSVMLN